MFCGLGKGQRDTMLSYYIMIVLTNCWHLRYVIIARQLIMPLICVNIIPKCYNEHGQFMIFAENLGTI